MTYNFTGFSPWLADSKGEFPGIAKEDAHLMVTSNQYGNQGMMLRRKREGEGDNVPSSSHVSDVPFPT